MIRTVEIPRERWQSFLEMIDRLASGRPVRLEVARRELGDQDMASRLPLIGVELEQKGSDRGELVVSVATDRGELTHVIGQPTGIAIGLNDNDEPQWLAVAEPGDAITIIHFEQLAALSADYAPTP